MKTERLLKLAKYLDKVPAEKFDISSWKCGTTACAVGHACSMPAFKKLGLYMYQTGLDEWGPGFDGESSWDAVEKFFDISHKLADHLFSFDGYDDQFDASADQVAERIREAVGIYERLGTPQEA